MDYDRELHLPNAVLRRTCDIGRNDHVLDIGCGAGLTTREAARCAAMGRVVGVDTSAKMLARARELSEAEHLHHVSFEQGDVQVHRLPPAYFDIAISRYGTMFFRDPVAAFRNIAEALVPGGRLVMMVWQAHAANEWSTSIQQCLAPEEPEPVAPAEGLDPFSLCDPNEVTRILVAAGFADIEFIDVCEPVFYGESVEVALEWVGSFLFVRELLRGMDADSMQRALQRLRKLLAAHHNESGVWFGARSWIVTGVHRGAGGARL